MTLWANWGVGSFTARAVARVARLMQRGGDWEGRQLLDRGWVAQALRYAGTPSASRQADPHNPLCGLVWYTNEDGEWPAVPRDAFAGAGAQHQVLVAVPSLDLIVVRLGQRIAGGRPDQFWAPAYETILAPVMAAITA